VTKKPLLPPLRFVAQTCSATLESMDLKITPKHLVLTLVGWAFALSAAAQWQWIDKDGRKVFSDRPPSADIKDKDILKQPGGRGRASVAVKPSESGDAATPAVPVATAKEAAPKLSGKNAELEAKKKKLEDDEAAKKKAEDEKVALGKADNCERAKKAVTTLQSGVRVSTTNAKGEREFMDDNTRATETQRLQGIVDSDCK
jgi:cytoskeletal protein RodZ